MELLQASCRAAYGRANASVIAQHYNYTGRLQNRAPGGAGAGVGPAVLLCFSVLIVLENLLVLLALLLRRRSLRRWLDICVANMALSDMLTGVAYVANICMSGARTLRLTPPLWLLREGLLFVALAASVFSLLLIAVERYGTMMRSGVRGAERKACRIYAMVALCWTSALAIGFLPSLGWNCVCDLAGCSTLLPLYSKSYILFALALFSVILVAIGGLYFSIYWHVRRNAALRSRTRSIRLLKAVISIVGAFVVCWGPLFVLLLVDYSCQSRLCDALFSPQWAIALAVLNSAVNPLIYSLGSQDLRRAIGTLLCCICHPESLMSKETSSTSASRHSFSKARNLSASPRGQGERGGKKKRLSSTTSCLSASSG